jgi:hypothetical protein
LSGERTVDGTTPAGRDPRPTWRELRVALSACLCVLAGTGCGGEQTAPKPPPRLRFAATTHEFGRVAQGAPVEHTFTFDNAGGVPLTIMQLRTGCEMEAVLLGSAEVTPGGGGAVRVRFDTRAVHGPQRRTVTVYSNDPAQRAVLLSLAGDVALDVAAEPPQIHLGSVPPGAGGLRQVALLSGNGARFGAPATDAPQLEVQVVDVDGQPRLAIGTAAAAPAGPFVATVRIPTTSPTRPVVQVEVGGVIRAPAAAPDQPPLS